MDEETIFEFEDVRSRAEIAQYLRQLAGQLDAGGDVTFADGERTATVRPPDRLGLELEVEREGERADPGAEFEIEVELEWTGDHVADSSTEVSEEADAIRDDEGAPGTDSGTDSGSDDESAHEIAADADEESTGDVSASERSATGTPDLGPVDVDAPPSRATFEVYRDQADEWRWRLVHHNGNIIATSGEGYTRRSGAENGLGSVVRNAPGAEVVVGLQEERDDGEDEEDGDEDLRDLHANTGDTAGADDGGDDRQDEE